MWCTGRNNLSPLNVIYKLHIGVEIADVNLNPFDSYLSYFNPIKIIGSAITWDQIGIMDFTLHRIYQKQNQ